jgi:hypothetical protein
MNETDTSPLSVLIRVAEKDIPRDQIDLWPRLRESLATTRPSWERELYPRKGYSLHRQYFFILAALASLALAVFLLSPPGRVFAQQVFHFFIPTADSSRPLPVATTTPAGTPGLLDEMDFAQNCPQDFAGQRDSCLLSAAETAAGFRIQVLPPGENGLVLSGLEVDTDLHIAFLYYAYQSVAGSDGSVWIAQGLGEFPTRIREDAESDWGQVPAQTIQNVTVHGQPAEFVEGQWVQVAGAGQYIFTTDVPGLALRWRDGGHWFHIFVGGQPELAPALDKDGLIRLAESLQAPSP